MKKSLMLLGNVLIILVIMAFIMLYVSSERQKMLVSQTEAFKNMTVAMESVTTNYLVGEQQVCRSWSNSYNDLDIFSNGFDDLLREENKVNVTRAYINPINAIQSIGFCCCWPSTWPT